MNPPRTSQSRLPPRPRPVRRFRLGRALARVLCALFALVGLLPLALIVVARMDFAQRWVQARVAKELKAQGIVASYTLHVRGFPPALELDHVEVESSDGLGPLLRAGRVSLRPRLFALLSGKLLIDQIEIEDPKVRVVIENGELKNLKVTLPKSEQKGPLHLPFDSFAITDAEVDLTVEGVRVLADTVDVDVTVQDDRVKGSTLETEFRVGSGTVHRARVAKGEALHDDDAICSLEGRVRIEPTSITVRRLSLQGTADLDHRSTAPPPCDLPATDKRYVDLQLSHVHVALPQKPNTMPTIQGHVKAHVPLAVADRVEGAPSTDGWASADVDVAYAPGRLPEVKGSVEAGGVRVEQFSFARSFQASGELHAGVVRIDQATLGIADGAATLRNVEVRPFEKGMPLKASLDVRDASFNSLMHDLGVAKHPWLEWRIKEVHAPLIEGTLDPIKIDGDFTARTPEFIVFDGPIDHPGRSRMVHIDNADIAAHLAIRPDALQFRSPRVTTARSHVQGELVSIGFDNKLDVIVPEAHVDFGELGPIASTKLEGVFDGSVRISPNTHDPKLEADGSVTDFVLGDMPLGTVQAVKAHLDINPPTMLTLTNARGHKGKSDYEMPEGRMSISGSAGIAFDGRVRSSAFDLRDLLDVFHMSEDPRFAELQATLETDDVIHVALGGPEDRCGDGYFTVSGPTHLTNVVAFGEEFEEGDLNLDLRFYDRLAGVAGAEIDLSAISLYKVRRSTDRAVIGSVLGSATIARGGALHGSAVMEGLPLGRVQLLMNQLPRGTPIEGTTSGIVQLGGTVDAISLFGDVDVRPVRVRGVTLGASHVKLAYAQPEPRARYLGRTGCGAPIPAEFDKQAYLANTAPVGTFTFDGDLFGGQVELAHLTVSQQKQSEIAGTIRLRGLDIGAARALQAWKPASEEAPSARLAGELSGDLLIDHAKQGELGLAKATFVPLSASIESAGRKLTLRKSASVVTMRSGAVVVEPLDVDLVTPEGISGSLSLKGRADHLDADPTVDFDAELKPVDLGLLVGVVPRLDRAAGSLVGAIHVSGRASDPEVDGDVKARASEIAVHGWPSVISNLELDFKAGRQELTLTRGTAKFAGGTITATGRLPIKDLQLGEAEVDLAAKNIRLAPADGVSAALDANLTLTLDPNASIDKKRLPQVRGEVVLLDFDYSRPVSLSTDILQGRAQKTEVETYDPQLDALSMDISVRAKGPLRIHNNLVDAQLAFDTPSIIVSGTNQRFGMRGALRALPGGRFQLPFTSSVFDVKQATIRFDDPTRVAPNVDVTAQTEYRRGGDTLSGGSVVAYGGSSASFWRFTMNATGSPSDLKIEFTSDPQLSKEDIMLLLTVGMTRAEIEQIRGGLGGASAGAALEALNLTGAGTKFKESLTVIDDFRFGSAYSPHTGRSEPQVTVTKRITKDVNAQVTTSLAEDRELRAAIQLRLSQRVSAQAAFDNVYDQFSPGVGNIGLDLRWRLEFE